MQCSHATAVKALKSDSRKSTFFVWKVVDILQTISFGAE